MWDLPLTVNIDGEEFAIEEDCDYRIILDCLDVYEDNSLDLESRHLSALMIFYKEPKKIKNIEKFLAKIENPAIIEVHTGNFSEKTHSRLKKWELSTMLANDIEAVITKPFGSIPQKRINSVGYGEFLPAKNTPNNGGKYLNRIDIIVLCNISGE